MLRDFQGCLGSPKPIAYRLPHAANDGRRWSCPNRVYHIKLGQFVPAPTYLIIEVALEDHHGAFDPSQPPREIRLSDCRLSCPRWRHLDRFRIVRGVHTCANCRFIYVEYLCFPLYDDAMSEVGRPPLGPRAVIPFEPAMFRMLCLKTSAITYSDRIQ